METAPVPLTSVDLRSSGNSPSSTAADEDEVDGPVTVLRVVGRAGRVAGRDPPGEEIAAGAEGREGRCEGRDGAPDPDPEPDAEEPDPLGPVGTERGAGVPPRDEGWLDEPWAGRVDEAVVLGVNGRVVGVSFDTVPLEPAAAGRSRSLLSVCAVRAFGSASTGSTSATSPGGVRAGNSSARASSIKRLASANLA